MSEPDTTTLPSDAIWGAISRTAGVVADAFAKATRGDGQTFAAAQPSVVSLLTDPNTWALGQADRNVRPSYLGWTTLRRMAVSPLIAAIIRVRVAQVQEFCRPSESRYRAGFQIRLRERKRSPTRVEAKMMADIERWLVQCGTITDRRQYTIRHGLPAFAGAVTKDSLTYDQGCAEVVPTVGSRLRDGGRTPGRLQWVDASTIRLAAAANDAHGLPDDDFETPRYVQVWQEQVVAEYEPDRLLFWVRNPTTELRGYGYGISEQELLIRILTAWLNVFDRNSRYFTQGWNAKGLLNIKRNPEVTIPEPQLAQFRADIQRMAVGATGAHRLPVTHTEGLEFIELGNEVQDAQWPGFSDQAVKIACAIHLMDPAEINHVYGNQGQKAAMGGASAAERVEESRARGLVPIVRSFWDSMNRWVVWAIDEDFEAVATGLERDSAKDDTELLKEQCSTFMQVNEARAIMDLPPAPHGDIILNPTYFQAMQASGGGGGGGGGGEAGEPLDVGGLFDEQQRATGDAAADSGAAPPDMVDNQQQPLAASSRRGTVTIIL